MFRALRLERVSNQGLETINQGFEAINLELSIKLLSAIVKLRIPLAILLVWQP